VKHAIGEQKKWRPLQRYIGRREHYTPEGPRAAFSYRKRR
jgi:hypothetical protein